ncbi:MAG: undecaprenyl-diphosphate phosphatase, partial [Gammaproteobacteria bacterium]
MDYSHLLILGLVQGLTEFLPVSSSAHLILVPRLAGWEDQGLVFDIFAHLGSFIAVLLYFHKDLARILPAWANNLHRPFSAGDGRIFWYLLIATFPSAVAGLLLYETVATMFRNPLLIACTSIFFALLLWLADYTGKRMRKEHHLSLVDAVWIGMAQVLSLVPGTSRSGITMTAGLFLGLDRHTAARFSFLLALPTILLAGGYDIYKYLQGGAAVDPG